MTSFEIVCFPSAIITLVESFPCASKDELIARERFHIGANVCVNKQKLLNKTREDQKQYNLENKEHLDVMRAKWALENAESIKARRTTIIFCECGGQYSSSNKVAHIATITHIKNMKIKEDLNSGIINEKLTICECGIISTKKHLEHHKISKKHIRLINNLANIKLVTDEKLAI